MHVLSRGSTLGSSAAVVLCVGLLGSGLFGSGLLVPAAWAAPKTTGKASQSGTTQAAPAQAKATEAPAADPFAADAESDSAATTSAGASSDGVSSEAAPPSPGSGAGASAQEVSIAGSAGHLLFVEGGMRQDWGTSSERTTVGNNVQTDRDSVDTLDSIFHFGYLGRVGAHWRLGTAFGYAGNYNIRGNDLIGQLLTWDGRLEYAVRVAEKVEVLFVPRLGIQVLLPGGRLAERIDENQLYGYDTWGGPRFGMLAGGDAGARYALTSWLSARATVGYAWTLLLLLNSIASDGGITATQTWTVEASRLGINLGLEVTF